MGLDQLGDTEGTGSVEMQERVSRDQDAAKSHSDGDVTCHARGPCAATKQRIRSIPREL